MKRKERMLVVSSALLMLWCGCAAPKFALREPPTVKMPKAPPQRPEFKPVLPAAPVVSADKAQTSKLPDWRRRKVAVLGFGGYSPDHLMLKLMQGGMKRIADLEAAPYILVAANETSRNGSIWWASILEMTARIGKGVSADYILIGAFTVKAEQKEEQVTQFYIPDAELARYGEALKLFVEKMQAYSSTMLETERTYLGEYEAAREKYEEEKKAMGWKVTFAYEGPFKDKTEEVESFKKTVATCRGTAQANIKGTPDVPQLRAKVEAHQEITEVPFNDVELSAKLLDVQSGSIIWLTSLRKRSAESTDVIKEELIRALVDQLATGR
jgi:hypothetical protein